MGGVTGVFGIGFRVELVGFFQFFTFPFEVEDPTEEQDGGSGPTHDRCSTGGGSEVSGRNEVLDLRGTRDRGHREGEGAQGDGSRNELTGDVGFFEER